MKISRYSDPLILSILRHAEGGVPVAERHEQCVVLGV